jgi:hypothetical protein
VLSRAGLRGRSSVSVVRARCPAHWRGRASGPVGILVQGLREAHVDRTRPKPKSWPQTWADRRRAVLCAVRSTPRRPVGRQEPGASTQRHWRAVPCRPVPPPLRGSFSTNPASALTGAAAAGSPPGHLPAALKTTGDGEPGGTFAPVNSSCSAASPRSEIPVRPAPVNLKFPHH